MSDGQSVTAAIVVEPWVSPQPQHCCRHLCPCNATYKLGGSLSAANPAINLLGLALGLKPMPPVAPTAITIFPATFLERVIMDPIHIIACIVLIVGVLGLTIQD
jgi:hypothetical protein